MPILSTKIENRLIMCIFCLSFIKVLDGFYRFANRPIRLKMKNPFGSNHVPDGRVDEYF